MVREMTAVSSRDALEAQPILDGAPASHLPTGGAAGPADQGGTWPPAQRRSRWRDWADDPFVRSVLVNMALICTWYFFSTLLSLFNKIVVGKEHGLMGLGAFPAPFLMSSTQFFCQHLIARGVLLAGWVKRKSDGSQTWRDYLQKVVPNGVATGLDIGFSNYSLVYITLSFYVMCKSTTPLFLLVFAIIWGIERPSWSLAAVVSVISAGLLLLVYGETRFHLVGFILVMTAAMLAGLRWTITQVLLQDGGHGAGAKKHGGPVEVLYQLTPVMGFTLLGISLGHERLWATLPASPYFATVWMTLGSIALIFMGGIIAFAMVLAEFALIANTSALTFMVAGTFKEIVTVAAAVVFLGEPFTWINGLGLLVLIAGVVLFNWLKYQKLREQLAAEEARGEPLEGGLEAGGFGGGGGRGGDSAPYKLGSEEEEEGEGAGSEVELSGGGLSDGHAGGLGGPGAGWRGRASAQQGQQPGPLLRTAGSLRGSGEHAVLMLGVREGFLVDDSQLPSPAASWRRRNGGGGISPTLRGGGGRTPSPRRGDRSPGALRGAFSAAAQEEPGGDRAV